MTALLVAYVPLALVAAAFAGVVLGRKVGDDEPLHHLALVAVLVALAWPIVGVLAVQAARESKGGAS